MSLTLNDIKEQLGESLHTALRKCTDSKASSALYGTINMCSDAWGRYLSEVKHLLDTQILLTIDYTILEMAVDNFQCPSNDYEDLMLLKNFKMLSEDDFKGMASFLADDLKKLNLVAAEKESSLVNCDTIHKAIKHANTLPTLEKALTWITTWEHERALKSDTLETFFDFAVKEVVANFKEVKIAFWQYDRFPFLLHSPIEGDIDSSKDGCVKLSKYGKMSVQPTYILPQKVGEEFAKKLDRLSSRKSRAIDEINELYKDELNNINKRYSGYKT